jgi:hypothetical protein
MDLELAVRLEEHFMGEELDFEVWLPYYLPHWSSRAGSAATYFIDNGDLRLSIPPEQQLWCPEVHDEPLRVSCIQSGNFAGPLGSTIGQQPINDSHTVREAQPTFWGYTPQQGRIEIRMRATSRNARCSLSGCRGSRTGQCDRVRSVSPRSSGTASTTVSPHRHWRPQVQRSGPR